MSGPSPFEPGYVPPAGAKLPPPLDPNHFGEPSPVSTNWTDGSAFDFLHQPAPHPQQDGPEHAEPLEPEPKNSPASASRVVLAAVVALSVGVGVGFGLGYSFAGAPETANTKVTPTRTPDPEPDPELRHPVLPEPDYDQALEETRAAQEKAEGRSEFDLDRRDLTMSISEDGEMLFGPNGVPSVEMAWGEIFDANNWSIRAYEPIDVTHEIVTSDGASSYPEPGFTNQLVQLTAIPLNDQAGPPEQALTARFISSDNLQVSARPCANVPNTINYSGEVVPDEPIEITVCLAIPENATGRWQFELAGSFWFHYPTGPGLNF